MTKTLTSIREQGNKEFENSFPFQLFHEGGMVSKNEEIKEHINQREDNIIKGVIEMLEGMKTCDEKECYKDHDCNVERIKDNIIEDIKSKILNKSV